MKQEKASSHALLSPSSAERWFNCPGSINLIKTLPVVPLSSIYAAEGTVAHRLAEEFVNGKTDLLTLTSMVGRVVVQDGFDIEITDAMVEGAIEYADAIAAARRGLSKPAPVFGKSEVKVRALIGEGMLDTSNEVWGTADYLLYQKGHELHVFDFKFGKGVVEEEENKQGLIYLVAAQDTEAGYAFDHIYFHIVQPRARHSEGTTRTWRVEKERLSLFRQELLAAVEATRDSKAPRVAGGWCKFCPALAYCPEAAGSVQSAARTEFTKAPLAPSILPPVASLTAAQVARALEWEDAIDFWFEAVRERARIELEKDATSIPGYKLVEGKTNRAWADEDEAATAFALLGEGRYAPRKLKSPAQMEKLASKEEVAKYTMKPPGRATVAPESDKRPAMTSAGQAKGIFDVVAEKDVEDGLLGDLVGAAPASQDPLWPV